MYGGLCPGIFCGCFNRSWPSGPTKQLLGQSPIECHSHWPFDNAALPAYKNLLDEATFYDKQWQATWEGQNRPSESEK